MPDDNFIVRHNFEQTLMNDNNIGQYIFDEFMRQARLAGITIAGIDQETGAIHIPNSEGQIMLVRLDNLIDYYAQTGDPDAVSAFVGQITEIVLPQRDPTWEQARDSIYISLYPSGGEPDNPLASPVTPYFDRFFILDTPTRSVWILPDMLREWDVTPTQLESQALANGARLLDGTPIEVGNVEGHPLGSFRVEDRTLNAALLMAPNLKEKVMEEFGFPVYAVIPDKVTCYFFGRDHFDYFAERIGGLVAEHYEGSRHITPELLEFSDAGIRPLCSWINREGYVVRMNAE